MIDAAARGRLRTALAQLIDGEISTDEFTLEMTESVDAGVREIGLFGSELCSDEWNRRLKGKYALDPETRRMAERCLQFLETDLEFGWPHMEDHTLRWCLTWLPTSIAAAPGIVLGLMALIFAALFTGSGRDMDAGLTALVGISLLAFSSGIFWVVYRFDRRREERELEEYKRAGDWEVWPFLKSGDYSGPHGSIGRDFPHHS